MISWEDVRLTWSFTFFYPFVADKSLVPPLRPQIQLRGFWKNLLSTSELQPYNLNIWHPTLSPPSIAARPVCLWTIRQTSLSRFKTELTAHKIKKKMQTSRMRSRLTWSHSECIDPYFTPPQLVMVSYFPPQMDNEWEPIILIKEGRSKMWYD